MRPYEEIVQTKWSRINERVVSIDIVRMLRDKNETLSCDVIPLVYIGESGFYVTDFMFFAITGVIVPDRIVHRLKSGVNLYQYDFMEFLANRLNQYETMTSLQKAMLTEYKRINKIAMKGFETVVINVKTDIPSASLIQAVKAIITV